MRAPKTGRLSRPAAVLALAGAVAAVAVSGVLWAQGQASTGMLPGPPTPAGAAKLSR